MDFIQKILHSKHFRILKNILDPESVRISKFIQSASTGLSMKDIIVDVGAGQTPYKKFFKKCNYIAVDFGKGETNWDYSGLDIVADIHKLPIRNEIADVALLTEVLEHSHSPQISLSEIARILKPGGRLYLTVPQGLGEHQVPFDFFRYTQYGLRVLCERAGLNVISIRMTTGFFGYFANRMTMIPKILFWSSGTILRIALFPIELVSYLFFVLLPVFFVAPLDILDKRRNYTLHYTLIAVREKEHCRER